ncbi:MAG: ABC transporter ATP-binding protein [Planctomycetota bacterium]
MTEPRRFVLETEQLMRIYRQGKVSEAVLKGVSLKVVERSFVAITGPSGSGKSTLLNLLAGLDTPSSGTVRVDGQDLSELSERQRTMLRREKIGFVFQFFNLVPTLTVAENIGLPLTLAGVKSPRDDQRFQKIVERFGLGKLLDRRPHALSGGEMQRTSIARAVVHEPPIVLADEPTGNLSTRAGMEVLRLLRQAVDDLGRTVLLVTHNPRDAAQADQVRFLRDGELLDEMLEGPDAVETRIADRMALLGL